MALSLLVGAAVVATDDPPKTSTVVAGKPEKPATGFNPAGQLLVRRHVPDEDPRWFFVDPESGDEHPMPAGPIAPDAQDRPSYLARAGALVAVIRGRSDVATVWVLSTEAPGRWRRVGTADQVIPSESARGVWLADAERDGEGKQVGMRVREVDVLSGEVARSFRMPCCRLSQHVDEWLLYSGEDFAGQWDIERARTTRRTSERAGVVAAANDSVVAVLRGPCDADSQTLVLEHRETGDTRSIGEACRYDGAGFSPDGRSLAAWRHHDGAAAELVLIDVASGRETAAPSSITDAYSFAWTPGGRIYYVDADFSTIRWFQLSGNSQETGTIPTAHDDLIVSLLQLVPPADAADK